ncbi:MAG TPA: nitroreductase family deazaflavin-dependent oxidoreductase [Jatrophihabitantaceae bacterium]
MTSSPRSPATKPKPPGLERPSTVRVIKVMSVLHRAVYKASGGRVLRNWKLGSAVHRGRGVPICLVTTIGRKSGQRREVPLCYLADGDRVIVVASQGGLPTNPQWYLNTKANPDVEVRVGTSVRRMRARTADAAERAALWPRLVDLYNDYASYATWTDREIPVVICEPNEAGPA